jgi:NAD(P)-dependent dehydrogenase (short-subunit alcohol dehydrogenase family)
MAAVTSTGSPGRPTWASDPDTDVDGAHPFMTSLDGLTAIVAGAGPGIGRACAAALRREGADVVVAARNAARLEALAAEVADVADVADLAGPTRPSDAEILPIAFDLADPATCRALVDETLARLGRLDILVNVATAGGDDDPMTEGEWESWRRAFEVNVIGTLELTRLAAQAMPSGGSIIQIGTIGTRALPPGRARYTATKSAMVTASLTMAKELGPAGVRVNVVTPGFTTGGPLTAMMESIATRSGENTEEVSSRLAAGASLRRHVDPEDVAEAVVFLAGPRARNVTGIELPVTAGR